MTKSGVSATDPTGVIFVSYARADLDFALKLTSVLKNSGILVWMAPFEIALGADWRRKLQAALADAAAMICVLSADFVSSKYCLDELASIDAYNRNNPNRQKPLLPVFVSPVPDENHPLEIRRLQHVQFYDADRDWRNENLFEERMAKLIEAVRAYAAGALVGDPPGREVQYLNQRIAEWEGGRGVKEFVELSAETRDRQYRADDEFGYSAMLPTPDGLQVRKLSTIAEAVGMFDRFVLLGEPGAGKTTALRRLALRSARARLTADRLSASPLPMLLYLPKWTTHPAPAAFVRKSWQEYGLPAADPIELARIGEVILYFDGLNEMGEDGSRKARLLADWIRSPDGPKHAIISCRTQDYDPALFRNELPLVTISELDETGVRQFAANYLGREADRFLARVLPPANFKGQAADGGLSKVSTNPYLLGALVILFKQSPGTGLPTNNGMLVQKLVKALWQRESIRSTRGWLAFEKAELHFANMAYSMIEEGKPQEVAMTYAVNKLGDESMLYLGASASFLEVAEGAVRFYHQLIQEYFAAVLVEQSSVARLAPEQRWREVLAAASGMAADPDLFVREVLAADAIAAAHCVTRGANVRRETIDRVVAAMLWDLDKMATLEASFAYHMATNPFGSWGSVEMANDAMDLAVDKLSAEVNLEFASALRSMGSVAIEALDRIGSEAAIRVRDYINDPRPHRTEGGYLMPRTFGNPYYSH